jgi:hypothetical protein
VRENQQHLLAVEREESRLSRNAKTSSSAVKIVSIKLTSLSVIG